MTRIPLTLAILLAACGGPTPEPRHADPTSGGATNTPPTATPRAEPTSSGGVVTTNAPVDPAAIPAPPDVGGIPPSAVLTASGLASRVIRPGTGTRHPTAASRVLVHYSGWTPDGHMFDSSLSRGAPAEFPLSAVIAGWTEGLQLMVEGEVRRLWIPGPLAYGDVPRTGRPTGMLVFDVELLAIDPP